MSRQREGLLLCLVAAAGFSTTGIIAKLAYAVHVHVTTLLFTRFALASVILWLAVIVTRQSLPSWRVGLVGFFLGLVGYGSQTALLFLSLQRIGAALSSLLFYIYPALVTVGALAIGREQPTRRRLLALAIALGGVVLVFSSAFTTRTDAIGVLLSLASAAGYAVIILIVDGLGERVRPLVLSTLAPTGAAVAMLIGGFVLGDLSFHVNAPGWRAIVALTILATVFPLVAFYAGIARVGPSTASILVTVEPALTVVLAAIVLQERLGLPQFVGGGLVLGAVILLQLRRDEVAPSAVPR